VAVVHDLERPGRNGESGGDATVGLQRSEHTDPRRSAPRGAPGGDAQGIGRCRAGAGDAGRDSGSEGAAGRLQGREDEACSAARRTTRERWRIPASGFSTSREVPGHLRTGSGHSERGWAGGWAARQAIVEEAKRQFQKQAVVALTWRAPRPTDGEAGGKLTDFEWNELLTPGSRLNQRWCEQVTRWRDI